MKIIMVKKFLEDGSECKKCIEVYERIQKNDELKYINEIIYADLREPQSEGIVLAEKYDIDIAPFFIVEKDNNISVFTSYMQLRKEVFNTEPEPEDIEIEEKRKVKDDPDEDLYWM
ncbi:MAG: hypothetical protein JXR58_10825 [Bacteroidales bacterium]|nr:hypothetical protein [Bacteroidales bacterium]